jgi:hypothetical protein
VPIGGAREAERRQQLIRLWWIFTSYLLAGARAIVTHAQLAPDSPKSRETQSIRWNERRWHGPTRQLMHPSVCSQTPAVKRLISLFARPIGTL